jgi:hypothetical protein
MKQFEARKEAVGEVAYHLHVAVDQHDSLEEESDGLKVRIGGGGGRGGGAVGSVGMGERESEARRARSVGMRYGHQAPSTPQHFPT